MREHNNKESPPEEEAKEELINSIREAVEIVEDKLANCLKMLEDN